MHKSYFVSIGEGDFVATDDEGYIYIAHKKIVEIGDDEIIYVEKSKEKDQPAIPILIEVQGPLHQIRKGTLEWETF